MRPRKSSGSQIKKRKQGERMKEKEHPARLAMGIRPERLVS